MKINFLSRVSTFIALELLFNYHFIALELLINYTIHMLTESNNGF